MNKKKRVFQFLCLCMYVCVLLHYLFDIGKESFSQEQYCISLVQIIFLVILFKNL